MADNQRSRDIVSTILIGVIASAALVMLIHVYLQSQMSAHEAILSYYDNSRYSYQVTVPAGWRLASKIIRGMCPASSSSDCLPDQADAVAMTSLDLKSEAAISNLLEQASRQGNSLFYSEFLSGRIFIIGAEAFDGGLDYARLWSTKRVPGTNVPTVENVRNVQTTSGIQAVRYETRDLVHPDRKIEIFYIPYPVSILDRYGRQVQGITIRTLNDKSFSETTFLQLCESFRFVR